MPRRKVIEQAAHRTEVVCLAGSRQSVTLLHVAASVGHVEVKVINHRDKTIVKTEKTNFEKLKLRYSGHGILRTQFDA